jgi:hypothetical protein
MTARLAWAGCRANPQARPLRLIAATNDDGGELSPAAIVLLMRLVRCLVVRVR